MAHMILNYILRDLLITKKLISSYVLFVVMRLWNNSNHNSLEIKYIKNLDNKWLVITLFDCQN